MFWRSKKPERGDGESRINLNEYRDLSRFANDSILLIDDEAVIQETNDRACEVYGYSREELLGRCISDLRAPHTVADFPTDWAKGRDPSGSIFEAVHRRKDGFEFDVEISTKLVSIEGRSFRQSIIRDISARKQAEAKLVQAEEMLRLLANNLKEMVLAFGMDRKLTYANAAVEALTGYSKDELEQLPFGYWINPGDAERMGAKCAAAFQRGSFQDEEYRIVCKDGTPKWASASWNPIIDKGGKQIGVQAVERDITVKKRLGEELRANERRYRCLFNSITDALFVNRLSPDGEAGFFIEANDVACSKLGYTREELLTRRSKDIIAPEQRYRLPQIMPPLRAEGFMTWESVGLAKDGHRIPIELRHHLFDLDGEPTILTAVHDISDRIEAETLFIESSEKYQKVVQNAPLGILIVINEMIRFANPAAISLLGAKQENELLSTNLADRIAVDARSVCMAALRGTAGGSVVSHIAELKWLRLNQTPLTVVMTAVPYMQGEEQGSLVFFSDITEMRQAQADKDAMHAQFLQAQKMESVGRLAGGVAHDFNNLLTVINGHSALSLKKMPAVDPTRDAMAEILKAGQQAAQLTKQLLAFSRRQVSEPRSLDINHCVLDLLKMLQRMVGDHIRIDMRLGAVAPVVWADRGQLQQVLMNLAVNGRDSMPDGGVLSIASENRTVGNAKPSDSIEIIPGEYVVLSVGDTGCGMDEETRQRIFEPFFTTKQEGKGTGLGLSTVYGIVRQCGGWIQVHSRLEAGSRFDIFLPQRAGQVLDPVPAAAPQRQADKNKTVLIVEDSESVRRTVVELVENCGYKVLEADGGAAALKLAEAYSGPIDLLLTDVHMPLMTGPELVVTLRKLRPDTRVIFMSGYAEALTPPGGMLNTSYTYLQKPFSPDELAMKIHEALAAVRIAGRLLVVDDEEPVRALFKEILEGAGYTVETACDGRKALKRMHETPFDLVLTDLVMPDKDGLEAIQAIRREYPHQKIIAVSGAFNGMFLRPAEIMGANRSLLKPVSPDALESAVRAALAE